MSEDIGALRRAVRASLPTHVRAALAAYRRFTAEPAPADAKGFAVWQSAARAALAHVESLVKLMTWAEGGVEAPPEPDDGLDDLLAQARAAMRQLDRDPEAMP